MKITALEIANVKRIKALRLEPTKDGLTVIGGKNGQGKTSVLDAIAYALGGENYKPSNLKRDNAVGDSLIHIETDDGLVIERKGKNASLTVTDSTGKRAGQTLLNSVVSRLAIDLPKFLNGNDREKADMLLQILGIGDKLAAIDREIKAKYDTRLSVGREADQKEKAAADMPSYEDAPEAPLSVSELIKEQQAVLARNGIKEEHRRKYEANKAELQRVKDELARLASRAEALAAEVASAESEDFALESTTELEAQIANFEAVNAKVAANAERARRMAEAAALREQYGSLTAEIEDCRAQRLALLDGADLPLPGLSVEDGVLTLNGKAWDCLSGSQQLIVGASIASRLNPNCRFVLIDKLEQLDVDSLGEFDAWLKERGLQCIGTRVSTGGECTIIIEDGESEQDAPAQPAGQRPLDALEDL